MLDASEEIKGILNFEQLTDWLGTSGQPDRNQFQAISNAGYEAVVNLALPTSDNAIAEEGSIVTGLGMIYYHIPVAFEAPTKDNLTTFMTAMRSLEGKNIWEHCVVNARVSAFVYHYLRQEKNFDDKQARSKFLNRWEPKMDKVWLEFMAMGKQVRQ